MTNLSVQERKQISDTILLQLGGAGRLSAMIGASQFSFDDQGALTFMFKMCKKANIIKIHLNGLDLYDITFKKYNRKTYQITPVKEFENIYNEDLKRVIEEYTGLYLTL